MLYGSRFTVRVRADPRGVIEVLDPERGEVLATLRQSATFRGFIGTDRAWSYEEDASGGRITIWRIGLVGG